MTTKDRIIRIAFIAMFTGLLIAVGKLGYDRYTDIKEDNLKAVSEYQRMQRYIIHYLENAEAFILLYPYEGAESQLQRERASLAETLEVKMNGAAEMMGELTDDASSYRETRVIEEIADEMNVYMNHFGTEKYPENEINLGFMDNLFELMVKYRHAIEEELDAYRTEDENDFFHSETYMKYQNIKQTISDENNWVLAPVSSGNESEPNLGPKLAGIDSIPTVIHSEEEGIPYAMTYFNNMFGNVSLGDIEVSGGGGSNIHGRMFTTYEYQYRNVVIELYETGDIESVHFGQEDAEGADESEWSKISDANFEEAQRIAQDYLKKHDMEDYSVSSYYLGYMGGNSGYINLIYMISSQEDYYDDLNTIEFTFINGESVFLESIWYPRHLYSSVLDKSNFDEGYSKKDQLNEKIDLQYPVIDAYYQNGSLEGNIQTYEWRFIVEKGEERYFIILDAETEEITSAYPVPKEWVMNGGA